MPAGLGQCALARPHWREREVQSLQGLCALSLVSQFLFGPGYKEGALLLIKRLQLRRLVGLTQNGFFCVFQVQVYQSQINALEPAHLAHQVTIDLGLGPVQGLLLRA